MTSRYLTVPDFDALTQDMITALQAVLTDWTADESDPGVYWTDETAMRFITMIEDFNDSADAAWVPRATGGALAELLSNVALAAVAANSVEMERDRYYRAWQALTRETEDYLELITREAITGIGDVRIRFEDADRDANRMIAFIADSAGDNLPDADRTTLNALYNNPVNHPIWLDWFLGWVKPIEYAVIGTVILRENVLAVQTAVRERLMAEIALAQEIGQTVYASRFIDAAYERGVVDDALLTLANVDAMGDLSGSHSSIVIDLGAGAPSTIIPDPADATQAGVPLGQVAPTGTDPAINIVFTQA